jgi:hypothetical protein
MGRGPTLIDADNKKIVKSCFKRIKSILGLKIEFLTQSLNLFKYL